MSGLSRIDLLSTCELWLLCPPKVYLSPLSRGRSGQTTQKQPGNPRRPTCLSLSHTLQKQPGNPGRKGSCLLLKWGNDGISRGISVEIVRFSQKHRYRYKRRLRSQLRHSSIFILRRPTLQGDNINRSQNVSAHKSNIILNKTY